jgi:hypothetical protein
MTATIRTPGNTEERLLPGDFDLSFFVLPVSPSRQKKQIIPAAAVHRNDPSGNTCRVHFPRRAGTRRGRCHWCDQVLRYCQSPDHPAQSCCQSRRVLSRLEAFTPIACRRLSDPRGAFGMRDVGIVAVNAWQHSRLTVSWSSRRAPPFHISYRF